MSTDNESGSPIEGETPVEETPETGVVPTTTDSAPVAEAVPETRRDALREKALAVSSRQQKTRIAWRIAMVIVIVAVIAAVAIVVTNVVAGAAGKPQSAPQNIVDGGFVVDESMVTASTSAGNGTITTPAPTPAEGEELVPVPTPATEPLNVRVFVDFHDADAAAFQLANAKQLSQWVREGAITLTYYPIASVTGKSNGTKYSLRAMSAAACVASYSKDSIFAYSHELLAQQPAVDTEGFTDSELADLAIAIGADDPKKVRACIEDQTYSAWAKRDTDALAGTKIAGTDVTLESSFLVLVDSEQYVGNPSNPAEFAQAVLKASSDAFYGTPTPTPSPTISEEAEPTESPAEVGIPPVEEVVEPAPGT